VHQVTPEEAAVTTGPVTATRRITASAGDIFAIVANPRRHLDLDGSGMLRGAVSDGVVTGVGDIFVMRMYYVQHGEYEMNNHVVEYELNRRIAWEPEAGRGHPDEGASDARWGQRWGFALEPDGPQATIVTQSYDCSLVPVDERVGMDDGRMWIAAMTATLQRLDELCSVRASRPPE
jgi:hypothetical protein